MKADLENFYLDIQSKDFILTLASLLHDKWRENRWRDASQDYEPRIKTTKDEQWIKVNGGVTEIDIANTDFIGLPKDWQAENEASAQVAAMLLSNALKSGTSLDNDFIEMASAVIHEKWLDRNHAFASDDQKFIYEDLSEDEKDKDRVIIKKAIELYRKNTGSL